ncbi:MAG: hypothetical protein WA208_04490, partial [Thermoanaerobaculia bacterium]
ICFPATTPASALAIGDEWAFDPARPGIGSPVYSTLDPLNRAGVELLVGGAVFHFNDFELKLTKPLSADFTGLYSRANKKNGPWGVSLSIDRARDDRTFLKHFLRGGSVSVKLGLYGNPIASGFDELAEWTMANCQVANVLRDVGTPNGLPEKIDLLAFRSGSTDIVSFLSYNTLAAMH